MRPHTSRTVAALAAAATAGAIAIAMPTAAGAADAPSVRITEWMYNPVSSAGEYVEITNLGQAPVSLAGWSFDDDSETPGTVPLDSLGTLAVGQSAIVTEAPVATFRSEWGLGADAKILGGNTTNLGRADEINIFSGPDPVANLVDRLTYNDQGIGAAKGPRTQSIGGIPKTQAALGADDASQWQLSVVSDAEASWASTTGDIGSPGKSRFAPAGAGPTPDWANIHINEVSSDNGATPVGDAVELFNSGSADVSIAGWLQIDSGAASAATPISAKLAAGATVSAQLSGRFVATGRSRAILLVSGSLIALGAIGLWATEDAGLGWVILPYLVFGLGFGFIADPVSVTALASLPREKAGLASSIISTSKQVGQLLGIAGAGTLLAVAGADEAREFQAMGGWVWLMLVACGAGIVLLNLAPAQTRPAAPKKALPTTSVDT